MFTLSTVKLIAITICGGVAAGLIVCAFLIAAEIYCDRQADKQEDLLTKTKN